MFSNTWPGSGSADTNFDITGFVYDNPLQRFIIATDATFTNEATAKASIFENTQLDSGASEVQPQESHPQRWMLLL